MVLACLCNKSNEFYQVFCANIVNVSTFIKINISKILDKILHLTQAPAEASTHWLSTETSIFHLFLNVQFALKSSTGNDNKNLEPENIQGRVLIRTALLDVLFMEKPILLASGFLVIEILKNSWKGLCKTLNEKEVLELKTKIKQKAEEIINYEWDGTLTTICERVKNDKMSSVLKSRHEAILVQLKHSLKIFS